MGVCYSTVCVCVRIVYSMKEHLCVSVCLYFVCSFDAYSSSQYMYRLHGLHLQLPYLIDGDVRLSQSLAVSCVTSVCVEMLTVATFH